MREMRDPSEMSSRQIAGRQWPTLYSRMKNEWYYQIYKQKPAPSAPPRCSLVTKRAVLRAVTTLKKA